MRTPRIGDTSSLGSDLLATARTPHTIHAPSRATLDRCDAEAVTATIREFYPDVIINAGAFHHAVLTCERIRGCCAR